MGAAALPIMAIATTAGGTMFQAASEASSLRAQGRQEAENGRLSIQAGEQDAMDTLRQARFDQGAAAASMAGSGLAGGGSIGTVLADSVTQAQMDVDRIRDRANSEADNHYSQARQLRKQAKNTIIGGAFSAVSNALSSASSMRSGRLGSMG